MTKIRTCDPPFLPLPFTCLKSGASLEAASDSLLLEPLSVVNLDQPNNAGVCEW